MGSLKFLIKLTILVLVVLFIVLSIQPISNFYNSAVNDGLLLSLEKYIDMKTLAVTIISLMALLVALMNYLRKSGYELEALLGVIYPIDQNEEYFQFNLILFNNKDKPLLITEAYITLPNNIYISLGVNNATAQNTDDKFVLKPFEIISLKTEKESKFVLKNTELLGINKVVQEHAKVRYGISIFTAHGEIKCKQLKTLQPKMVRALKDKSIVVANGVYPKNSNFPQQDLTDIIR